MIENKSITCLINTEDQILAFYQDAMPHGAKFKIQEGLELFLYDFDILVKKEIMVVKVQGQPLILHYKK